MKLRVNIVRTGFFSILAVRCYVPQIAVGIRESSSKTRKARVRSDHC